jgi:hypothetical protein
MVSACALRRGIGGLGLLATLSSCGASDPPLIEPSLMLTTSTLAPLGDEYDGPAVVERSVAGELVLAYAPDSMAGGTLPRHTTIENVGAFLFPVGAQVWLTKNPVVVVPQFGKEDPVTSLAVRTKENGPLLLGVVTTPDAARLAAIALVPMQVKGTTSRAHSDQCASGTLTTTTFDVQGDMPTAITDAETRVARIDGVDYDLGLVARQFDFAGSSARCSDYGPYAWFQLSVRAHDLAPLVATLDHGQGPACALGNDQLEDVSIGLFNVELGSTYDGPVFYMKRGTQEGFDCFDFSVPGLAATPGLPPPIVEACVPTGALAEPNRGEERWATIPRMEIAVLRQANRGDLIAASIVTAGENVSSAEISQALGLPVDVHPGCAYAEFDSGTGALSQYQLREAAFGAPSPVVVGSQHRGVVSTGATDYDVWLWDSGAITLLVQ